jgi:hypothetical protein
LEAGVTTFVHVSTAAVQGRRGWLDETGRYDLRSPYARAKALAEMGLENVHGPAELRLFRATSVQGIGRPITRSLVNFCNQPALPMAGDGSQPLPLSLIENTSAAIVHLSLATKIEGRYLHPWEGLTVNRMIRLFGCDGPGRTVRIPRFLATFGVEAGYHLGAFSSGTAASAKRAELLVSGQHPASSSMPKVGFRLPFGDERYVMLARAVLGRDQV